MMRVKDVMTTEFLTVDVSCSMDEVIELFSENNENCIIITDERKENAVVGVISEKDIIKKMISQKKLKKKIPDIMTKNIITISPYEEIGNAYKIMIQNDIKQLPVIEGNSILGLLRQDDVAKQVYEIATSHTNFLLYQNIQTIIILGFLLCVVVFFIIRVIVR